MRYNLFFCLYVYSWCYEKYNLGVDKYKKMLYNMFAFEEKLWLGHGYITKTYRELVVGGN